MEWFKLQYLIDEMMSMVKPIWVKEWKIKIENYSLWSKSYTLSIRIILHPDDYDKVVSQGEWKYSIIKREISDYVTKYISNYLVNCGGITSCEFYLELPSTSMYEESFFKDMIYV